MPSPRSRQKKRVSLSAYYNPRHSSLRHVHRSADEFRFYCILSDL
jgi:hypothetical protein